MHDLFQLLKIIPWNFGNGITRNYNCNVWLTKTFWGLTRVAVVVGCCWIPVIGHQLLSTSDIAEGQFVVTVVTISYCWQWPILVMGADGCLLLSVNGTGMELPWCGNPWLHKVVTSENDMVMLDWWRPGQVFLDNFHVRNILLLRE